MNDTTNTQTLKSVLETKDGILGVILEHGQPQEQSTTDAFHIAIYAEFLNQDIFELMYQHNYKCTGVDIKNYNHFDHKANTKISRLAVLVSFKKGIL